MNKDAFFGALLFIAIGWIVTYWHWAGWFGIVFGVIALAGSFSIKSKKYFCGDCGQYLGTSPGVCNRCGCNRYTEEDTGVGRTTRMR